MNYIKFKKKSSEKILENESGAKLTFHNEKRPIRQDIHQHKPIVNVSGYSRLNSNGDISIVNQYTRKNKIGQENILSQKSNNIQNTNQHFNSLNEGREWANNENIATREGRYNNTLQELQGKPDDKTLLSLYNDLKTTSDNFKTKLGISPGDRLNFDMTGKNDRHEIGFMNSISFIEDKNAKFAGITNNGSPILYTGLENTGAKAYDIDPSNKGSIAKLFGETIYKSLPTQHQQLWNDLIQHQVLSGNDISQSGRNVGSNGFGEYVSGILNGHDTKKIGISDFENIASKHNMKVNFKNRNTNTHISMENIVKYLTKSAIKK